jgi:two-component system invasion response regulator UvrY
MKNPKPPANINPGKAAAGPNGSLLRILIADDHDIVRKGLIQVLANSFDQVQFGEACNASQVLQQFARQQWDIVLLDITMPGQSGLDVLKQLRELQPSTKVLILSMHPEDQYAVRVLKAGAVGYITKNTASDVVAVALRKVLSGGTYVSETLAQDLARGLANDTDKQPHEVLSDREFQIMRLLASGKSVKEISFDLALSIKTVSTYRTRLLKKLGLTTTADVIRYAVQEGLVE